MMCVTFLLFSSLASFEQSERSSTICVVADERGSRPIARCFCSPSSVITALPRKPLAPVTRMISSAMLASWLPLILAHSRPKDGVLSHAYGGNPEPRAPILQSVALGPRFRGDERCKV